MPLEQRHQLTPNTFSGEPSHRCPGADRFLALTVTARDAYHIHRHTAHLLRILDQQGSILAPCMMEATDSIFRHHRNGIIQQVADSLTTSADTHAIQEWSQLHHLQQTILAIAWATYHAPQRLTWTPGQQSHIQQRKLHQMHQDQASPSQVQAHLQDILDMLPPPSSAGPRETQLQELLLEQASHILEQAASSATKLVANNWQTAKLIPADVNRLGYDIARGTELLDLVLSNHMQQYLFVAADHPHWDKFLTQQEEPF